MKMFFCCACFKRVSSANEYEIKYFMTLIDVNREGLFKNAVQNSND